MSRIRYFHRLGLCLVTCSVLVPACGTAPGRDSTTEAAAESGTLSMPLTASANGHTYRLRNTSLSVSGPAFVFLSSSDDPLETVLSATLPTGAYTAQLFGWQLERSREDGTFAAVQATLVSNSFVSFAVANGTMTTLTFSFQTDGVTLTVGSGTLRVVASVNEVPGVCTPFGSDCAAGAWCPPPELTGVPLTCVLPGVTPVGAACAGPSDCVANASCIDSGAGPVCVELCPVSGVGTECASGGSCQPRAETYGVCG
jgi:hypothetical protein